MEVAALGYRPCVGIMAINRGGLVWIGHRIAKAPDPMGDRLWQMPQGGLDAGETPVEAAKRELAEETGMRSVALLGVAPATYTYDLPAELIGKVWGGRFRGQEQWWVALRFLGDDGEIDISGHGHPAEFDRWRWAAIEELADLVVPFKRAVYDRVIADLARYAVPMGDG